MLNIGSVVLDNTPCIATPFTDRTPLEVIREAEAHYLDVAEARIDLFDSFEQDHVLETIERFARVPVIATIRSIVEGGKWIRSDEERLSLFEAILPHISAIDIEISSASILDRVVKQTKESGKLVIVSYHNYESTPDLDTLLYYIEKAKQSGADAVKIATYVLDTSDIQTLAMVLINKSERDLIVLGMGSLGTKTRILFPALGSLMTYAFLDKPTAAGQLSLKDTYDCLKLLYPEFTKDKSARSDER
jgi:3-dehydroquinate dehydratase I